MNTKIQLQDMFSYSKSPILILGGLVALYIIVLVAMVVIRKILKNNARKKRIPKPVNIQRSRDKYLKKLEALRSKFETGDIDIREAYQRMSAIIRDYVYAATGRSVISFTLEDVKKAEMPALQALMEEYYHPEFAKHSEGDVIASIEKTKRAIETWN